MITRSGLRGSRLAVACFTTLALLIVATFSATELKRIQAAQSALTPAELAKSASVPRRSFGRRLEPSGNVVLHGAGQSDSQSFNAYSEAVAPEQPLLFMSYVDLKQDLPAYFARLHAQLDSFSQFTVPQIGLSLNGDDGRKHYETDVASGAMDGKLQELCDGLRSLDRPVFLRPGYEFNGTWNGYGAKPYVAAFRRIVDKVRACGLENVAFVWDWSADINAASHAPYSWTEFYPGDAWVDWWGINLFAANALTSASTQAFLHDAEAHRFPVMIAESSAKQQPVDSGRLAIDTWFAPYFGLIRRSPVIKAFCYIDWDWTQYPQWSGWGDERIERNVAVLAFYRDQIRSLLYAHARSPSDTLHLLRAK